MTNFIVTNWITIAIVLMVLFYVGYLIYTNQWTRLRVEAYRLMWKVEKIYNDNQGYVKMTAVLNAIYIQLPRWLKYFVTVESMRETLQRWYNLLKDYTDDGEINDVRIDKVKL